MTLTTKTQYHMVPVYIIWYREYWTIKSKRTFETKREIVKVSYHPTHQHGHRNFWYVCLLKKLFIITQIAAIMYGMYTINGVYGPEPCWYSTPVPATIYATSCYIEPRYNGTWLYNEKQHVILIYKQLCNLPRVQCHIWSGQIFLPNRKPFCKSKLYSSVTPFPNKARINLVSPYPREILDGITHSCLDFNTNTRVSLNVDNHCQTSNISRTKPNT